MEQELERRVTEACCATQPKTRARWEALKAVRWVLRDQNGNYAALDSNTSIITVSDLKGATVFDGRDNETQKRDYYSRVTGMDYTVELI